METTTTKLTRPKFNEQMLNELSELVAKDILLENTNYKDIEECIEDAKSVLHFHYDDNGYELAKEFEDKGYSCDLMFVEDLDIVSSWSRNILNKHIRQWVKDNNIKLDIPIETRVIFETFKTRTDIGEIVKHYPDVAQYGVWSASEGKPKTSHYLINFEKIKLEP